MLSVLSTKNQGQSHVIMIYAYFISERVNYTALGKAETLVTWSCIMTAKVARLLEPVLQQPATVHKAAIASESSNTQWHVVQSIATGLSKRKIVTLTHRLILKNLCFLVQTMAWKTMTTTGLPQWKDKASFCASGQVQDIRECQWM